MITRIRMMKMKERAAQDGQTQLNVLNDLYGSYYRGVEYNTATDESPRYNEDGGNADAVVPGDKMKPKNVEFWAFIDPSGQNQLYHTPLLSKI